MIEASTIAFSGKPEARVCVDCDRTASWLIEYRGQTILDLCCERHAYKRESLPGARRRTIPRDLLIDSNAVEGAA